jgi:hypothetical protein
VVALIVLIDIVPPQLYAELSDAEEAARWRSEIEAEVARLDSAAK